MLIDHCDHQIVLLKSLKVMLLFASCFGTNMESHWRQSQTDQAEIENISITQAIQLRFVCYLVNTKRCEANNNTCPES